VTRSVAASSDADALRIFADPSFDARSSVVVEGIPATRPGAPGEVFAARRWFNSARMTVRSNGGWLVVPSNWDPGWRASVAGHDRRVHRVNFNQIGVRVPAGTIAVALHYRPPGLALGGVVSLCALASAVCLLVGPEFILSLRRHRWFSGDSGGVL
jgi:hypothetical protein